MRCMSIGGALAFEQAFVSAFRALMLACAALSMLASRRSWALDRQAVV